MKIWPYTQIVVERGKEGWYNQNKIYGMPIGEKILYNRDFVVYKIVNNWTGSEKIKKIYLN